MNAIQKVVIILMMVAINSCKIEPPQSTIITKLNKEDNISDQNRDCIDSLITSKELRQYLMYSFKKVDSLPDWSYPIIYSIVFNKDNIIILVKKSPTIIVGTDNYGCIGYYMYNNRIIQILDYYGNTKNQIYYASDLLSYLSDTIISPYNYINGIKEDAIMDLNLNCPRLYLDLEITDSTINIIEDKLSYTD